ncbi:hypothetical protein [Dyella sp. 2RAB6]|uniref:hypothetical protein n=1 Tax=Dyella sp. 2RAB6 TaxID=3232992 RepID=UPI003F927F65
MTSDSRKPSLWTALLFLHGYIVDPQLAQGLVAEEATEPTDAAPVTTGEAMRHLLEHGRKLSLRLCQGIGSGLVHLQ